jgi:hypothetical protein
MEHLLSMAAFAAVIAAQFLGVVFAAAMGGDARRSRLCDITADIEGRTDISRTWRDGSKQMPF